MDYSRINIDPTFQPLIALIFSLEEPFLRHFGELVAVRREIEAIGERHTAKMPDNVSEPSFESRLRVFRCDIGAFLAEVDERMFRSMGFLATKLGNLAARSYPFDRHFFQSVLRKRYFTDRNAWNGVTPSFAVFVEEIARQSEGRTLHQMALQDATNYVYTSLDYSSVQVRDGQLVIQGKAVLNILNGSLITDASRALRRILTVIASFYLLEPDYRQLLSEVSLEGLQDRTFEMLGCPIPLLNTPEPIYMVIQKDESIVFGYESPEATERVRSIPAGVGRCAYSVLEWFFKSCFKQGQP